MIIQGLKTAACFAAICIMVNMVFDGILIGDVKGHQKGSKMVSFMIWAVFMVAPLVFATYKEGVDLAFVVMITYPASIFISNGMCDMLGLPRVGDKAIFLVSVAALAAMVAQRMDFAVLASVDISPVVAASFLLVVPRAAQRKDAG